MGPHNLCYGKPQKLCPTYVYSTKHFLWDLGCEQHAMGDNYFVILENRYNLG